MTSNDYASMKKLNLEQNSPEWLEARKQYRTASEAAIVLGISPFQTPENFKLIKAGLKKQYYSKAMQQGHELEDKVRQLANEHFNLTFVDQCWVNGDYMASLDGIDGETLVELKVSDRTYNDIKNGITPEYYEVQVQQQLYCSPAEVGYIVAYSPKADAIMISHPIYPRSDFLPALEEAWAKFDAMPIPEEAIDLSDDGSVVNLFIEYSSLKAKAEEMLRRAETVKAKLIERAPAQGLTAQGYKLVQRKGSVTYDYKKAAADAGLELDPYRKEGKPSWTLSVPKSPFEAIE